MFGLFIETYTSSYSVFDFFYSFILNLQTTIFPSSITHSILYEIPKSFHSYKNWGFQTLWNISKSL